MQRASKAQEQNRRISIPKITPQTSSQEVLKLCFRGEATHILPVSTGWLRTSKRSRDDWIIISFPFPINAAIASSPKRGLRCSSGRAAGIEVQQRACGRDFRNALGEWLRYMHACHTDWQIQRSMISVFFSCFCTVLLYHVFAILTIPVDGLTIVHLFNFL
jgi:hypothetical protein